MWIIFLKHVIYKGHTLNVFFVACNLGLSQVHCACTNISVSVRSWLWWLCDLVVIYEKHAIGQRLQGKGQNTWRTVGGVGGGFQWMEVETKKSHTHKKIWVEKPSTDLQFVQEC